VKTKAILMLWLLSAVFFISANGQQTVEDWLTRGNTFLDQNNYNEAIQAYDEAINLKPDYPEAYYNKANAFEKQNKYEDAIQTYDKAIEINPNFALAWRSKADDLKYLGRNDEAAKAREKATELATVRIEMGPYHVSYVDYDLTNWTTDSYSLYDINSGWENDELKITRTPIGTVYHAVNQAVKEHNSAELWLAPEIWITHLTNGGIYAPSVMIKNHFIEKGYPGSLITVEPRSDVDGNPAYEDLSCKSTQCMRLVAWKIDDNTVCEVSALSKSTLDSMLSTLHIEQ